MIVLCYDIVIDNLKVDLVASRIKAVYYGVVGCNKILFLLGLEGGNTDCVGVAMLGSWYVLVTAAIYDGELYSVVCVKLVDWF